MAWIALGLLALHLAVWFGVLGVKYRRHSGLVPLLPPAREARLAQAPPVAVIVPARDEEKFIGQAVRSLLAQDYPDFHVVVANDHSTDRTGGILAAIAREHGPARLTVLDVPDLPPGWMGKCHAVHNAVRRAPAATQLYLFCDADVIHEPTALRRAVFALQQDKADLLGLSPRLDCVGFWENAILPLLIHLGVCRLNPRNFNDPAKNEAVAIGAFALVRRENYEKWGGHEAIKGEVIDDLAMGFMTKRAGGRIAFMRDPRAIHLRMYSNRDEIIRGFRKNMHTAVGGSVARMAGFAVGLVAVHLGPVAALGLLAGAGFPGGGAPALAAVAAWLATGVALHRRMGKQCAMKPLVVALAYPLGVLAVLEIMARSSWMGAWHGVVEWRGRRIEQPEQQVQIF